MFDTLNQKVQTQSTKERNQERPTLIVGDLARWQKSGHATEAFGHFQFTTLADLTATRLLQVDPAIIISPLVCTAFDAVEVATVLQTHRYSGCYRAISMQNVSTSIIRAEISDVAPDIDFDLLVIRK